MSMQTVALPLSHTHRSRVMSIPWKNYMDEEPQNNSIKPKLDWCSTGGAAELCGPGSGLSFTLSYSYPLH